MAKMSEAKRKAELKKRKAGLKKVLNTKTKAKSVTKGRVSPGKKKKK